MTRRGKIIGTVNVVLSTVLLLLSLLTAIVSLYAAIEKTIWHSDLVLVITFILQFILVCLS